MRCTALGAWDGGGWWRAAGLNYIQFTGMEFILFPLFVGKWCLARLVFPIYCTKEASSMLS